MLLHLLTTLGFVCSFSRFFQNYSEYIIFKPEPQLDISCLESLKGLLKPRNEKVEVGKSLYSQPSLPWLLFSAFRFWLYTCTIPASSPISYSQCWHTASL